MSQNLDDLQAEYRSLLDGSLSQGAVSRGTDKSQKKNDRWTRVVTRE